MVIAYLSFSISTIISQMQQFETDIITRGKLIQIKGNIQPQNFHLARLISKYSQVPHPQLQAIFEKLNYTGNELITTIVFTLLILSSELYNLFVFSSEISYECSIIATAVYTLLFSSLLNFRKQIVVQLFFLGLSIVLLFFSIFTSIYDYYAAAGVIFCIATCLLAKVAVYGTLSFYASSVTITFTFESNLLLFQFLAWKIYQSLTSHLGLINFNLSSLTTTIIALAVINLIKTYQLFDLQIIQLVNNFKTQHQNINQNKQKTPMEMTNSVAVFIPELKKQQLQEEMVSEEPQLQEEAIVVEKDSGANESISKLENLASDQPEEEVAWPQSGKRLLTIVISTIVSACYIAYLVYKLKTQTQANYQNYILWHFASFLRMTFLLMMCQYQKNVENQIRDGLNYSLVYLFDCLLILFSGGAMQIPALINITIEEVIVTTLSPLFIVKIFSHLNRAAHCSLNNGLYSSLFFLFLLPIHIRQIFTVEGLTIVTYILDGIAILYAMIDIFWACRDDVFSFVREVRNILGSKKNRLKIFERIKLTKFDYEKTIQNFLYFHILYMSISYYFISGLSQLLEVSYYILFSGPILFYLSALINSYKYNQALPQSYSPSILNVILLILSIAYIVITQIGLIDSNNQTWSMVVMLKVSLFVLTLQGERICVVYLKHFFSFIRVLIITYLFVLIYIPFIIGFSSGYFLSNFSQQFVFYYSISGFIYIWIIITCAGLSIHLVLNLTEKSKKELFVATYMESQMKKINMLGNMEKILMISNMYQIFNEKSEELLKYLNSEKHMMIAIRKQKQFEHDYELVDSEDRQKIPNSLNIQAKPVGPLDMIQILNFGKTQQNEEEEEEQNQASKNPVLVFLKELEKSKIQVVNHTDTNDNQLELKRMGDKISVIPTNIKQIEPTQIFKSMQAASPQIIADTLARLFLFLSEPSKTIGRQTFSLFLKIVTKEHCEIGESNMIYDRFGQNCQMDQYKFKKFILDYVNSNYQMSDNSILGKLRTFACRIIVPLLLARLQPFCYFIKRKKINVSKESLQIWSGDKNGNFSDPQFTRLRHKQLRKKANLLRVTEVKKKQCDPGDEMDEIQQEQLFQQRVSKKKITGNRFDRIELKDKNFLKSENIYSILVNSLIECYMFYQKEAQNFKIKSIKCTFSNILQILIKCNDIVFVFGYSTIYLFIAYYKEDYSESSPILSYISYPILLVVASFLVLAYIALIMYHKKDFETGTLGLDEDRKSLDFKSFKFYTKTVMFMLGSGLANYIIAIGLNSFICDSSTSVLYNFSDVDCYNKIHYGYMLISLLILVIYWPLSVITYPFNTAMQRGLEVKYKVQYQVIYLQVKFMINGFNTLLNPYAYQTEQLIGSILKGTLCGFLAVLYYRMQPCSYEFINMIEGKIYICLSLLSFAGSLCYFVGLLYSVVITGSLLFLYLIYFIYVTFKNYNQLKNDNIDNQIIEDNIKNQRNKKQIMRKAEKEAEQTSAQTLNKTQISHKIIAKEPGKIIEGRSQLVIFNSDNGSLPSRFF